MAIMGCSSISIFWSIFLLLIASAVPVAYLVSLELAAPAAGHVYFYRSASWLRECAKWDHPRRRFLVSSFSGGVSEIAVPEENTVLEEVPLVKGVDLAGNSSLGLVVDRPRNRVLVVAADVIGNRFSALVAYDLSTWQRLFLAQLTRPGDKQSFADDVAVDGKGNAYVTDVIGGKIWKVGPEGKVISTITSPLFIQKEWYKNYAGLNGIVYHPDGFLLAIHTYTAQLFKIELPRSGEDDDHGRETTVKLVKLVKELGGFGLYSLEFADGLELLSPTKLVVAGNPSARMLESSDGWESAELTAVFHGPKHRLATSVTVKDGKVFVSHMFGLRKHAIVEAVFTRVLGI